MMHPQEMVDAGKKITITDAELKAIDDVASTLDVIRRKHFDQAGSNTVDSMLYNICTRAKQELKLLLQQVEGVKG